MTRALAIVSSPSCRSADAVEVRTGYYEAMTQRERIEANLGRCISEKEWILLEAGDQHDVYA